ncbi:MAG: ABC transporter permease, partial [Acidimicrobiia bacterium]|nr:ABC transporter permease [Acidimicrobiia bacterium]
MKAFTIAAVNLKRFLRDRSNIFFVFVFPMLLVLIIGVVFGGTFTPRLAVATPDNGELAAALVAALEADDGFDVRVYTDRADAIEEVERGTATAALVIPDDYDARLLAGEDAALEYVAAGTLGLDIQSGVQGIVSDQSARILAARFVADGSGGSVADGLAAVATGESFVAGVGVEVVGEEPASAGLGQFDLGAAQQVALFVFVNALPAASQLVLTRKLRISHRMLSTPTAIRTIVIGEALGRFSVAFFQALFIILAAAVLFGV